MAIATTTGREITVDGIVLAAYQRAGLLSEYQAVDSAKSAVARNLLDTICKGLEAEGIMARSVSFQLITLATDTFRYDMPSSVLDVFGAAMWIDPTQALTPDAANELLVTEKTRDEWQRLTSKDAEARPLFYYVHRQASPIQVWVWPRPGASENGGLIRFQCHRLRADANDGAVTLDYEVYWEQYFIWELAYQLSLGAGMDLTRCVHLSSVAADKKLVAKRYSMQRPGVQFTVGHRSGARR